MGVGPSPSRVADLSFDVFSKAIHPEWFATRGFCRVARTSWESDIRIIDGGHAIMWSTGTVRLVQILAGAETRLPNEGLLFHSPVKREQSTSIRPKIGVDYQTCFSVERMDAQVFRHMTEELHRKVAHGGLFHQFGRRNRFSSSPLCRIEIEARPNGLSVQTFQTFPDERAIVRTQSLFELRPKQPY